MRLFLLLIALTVAAGASAQTTGTLLKSLERPDSVTGARVVAKNRLLIDLMTKDTIISGYRIRIYFDSSQNARQEVYKVRSAYAEVHPEDSIYVDYKEPYFKLTVGNFANYEEALMKWSQIVGEFKSAFIVQEKIPVSLFKRFPAPEPPAEPEPAQSVVITF